MYCFPSVNRLPFPCDPCLSPGDQRERTYASVIWRQSPCFVLACIQPPVSYSFLVQSQLLFPDPNKPNLPCMCFLVSCSPLKWWRILSTASLSYQTAQDSVHKKASLRDVQHRRPYLGNWWWELISFHTPQGLLSEDILRWCGSSAAGLAFY